MRKVQKITTVDPATGKPDRKPRVARDWLADTNAVISAQRVIIIKAETKIALLENAKRERAKSMRAEADMLEGLIMPEASDAPAPKINLGA